MSPDSPEPASNDPESITRWFAELKEGDDDAAQRLWRHYFPRLVDLARHRFGADRDPVYGADDAAQSVFHLLMRGAKQGRYDQVAGRDDLWRLLVAATRRRVIDRIRHEQAAKRGGTAVPVALPIDALATPEPSPEMLAMMDERLQELLDQLRDETLREIAVRRLEGYSNAEIADKLRVSQRTIERKLKLIRGDWEQLA